MRHQALPTKAVPFLLQIDTPPDEKGKLPWVWHAVPEIDLDDCHCSGALRVVLIGWHYGVMWSKESRKYPNVSIALCETGDFAHTRHEMN
jgi:hypothetical protein